MKTKIQEKRNELGQFVVGTIPRNKGMISKVRRENHPNWKGGNRGTSRKMAKDYGMDFDHCQICKEKINNSVIHHADGNKFNNQRYNLSILCRFCHHAIHDNSHSRETRFKKGHETSNEIREKISNTLKERFREQEVLI